MAETYMVNGMLSGKVAAFLAKPVVLPTTPCVLGQTQGMFAQGMGSLDGTDNTGVRVLQYAVTKSLVEGSPSSPALCIGELGMWRFRWVVTAGSRTVSVRVKQATTLISQRPTLTIKSNSEVGLMADSSSTASTSSDWVTIGPISFTATATGVVWVELKNNAHYSNTPAYFDHIVVT